MKLKFKVPWKYKIKALGMQLYVYIYIFIYIIFFEGWERSEHSVLSKLHNRLMIAGPIWEISPYRWVSCSLDKTSRALVNAETPHTRLHTTGAKTKAAEGNMTFPFNQKIKKQNKCCPALSRVATHSLKKRRGEKTSR